MTVTIATIELYSTRPRWGTFSVIDHADEFTLARELLLYDRLVFPVAPENDRSEWDRWVRNGWDPLLSRERLRQLAGLAEGIAWTPALRKEWSTAFDRLKAIGQDTVGIAYDLTPHVLTRYISSSEGPPPIPIAAFQSQAAARDAFLIREVAPEEVDKRLRYPASLDELHRAVGLLFERRLRTPKSQAEADGKKTLEAALELVRESKEFQAARRNLFAWEDAIVERQWNDIEAAVGQLDDAISVYNDHVRSHFKQTWIRRAWRASKIVLPAGTGTAGAVFLPPFGALAGAAVGMGLLAIEAHFPNLDEKPHDPNSNPAAALGIAMSALCHE